MNAVIKQSDAGDISCVPSSQHWATVRVRKCRDGYLQSHREGRAWLEQFAIFALTHLGHAPRVQVYAYGHDGGALLAVDADSGDRRTSLNLTVDLCGTGVELLAPVGDQLAIAVPGIVDAWTILGKLCEATHGIVTQRVSSNHPLCVAPPGT